LFKKIAKNKGKDIKKHGDEEAVLKDMQSDLNLPVVVNFKDGEFEVVNKTIMRKKGFKTTSPEINYESAQDPDIKDKEGTQPARYHAGLKKSTKTKRDAHFKKHGKKADNDSSAYKPAPGDATAKTKPSKYTKAFKDMYEEQDQILENWVTDLMNKLDAKSIHRNKYKKVAQYIKKELDKSGDKRSIEYHAADTIRKFNLDMDTKALAGMIRQLA